MPECVKKFLEVTEKTARKKLKALFRFYKVCKIVAHSIDCTL
jgi:hypothetical protein